MANKPQWISEYATRVDLEIDSYFFERYGCDAERNAIENGGTELESAIRYAVKTPGKRIRPTLFHLGYEIATGRAADEDVSRLAISLELIHAYTLVHDDLPCMDNDELRRGQPTVWKKYGEHTAVLAGDALQSMAFELVAERGTKEMVRMIAHMAGDRGIVLGQAMDLDAGRCVSDVQSLQELHRMKTGMFLRDSILSGAMHGNATADMLERLRAYGEAIGLAFQISDDLIDATGTEDTAGKATQKDGEKGYVYFLGMEGARRSLDKATETALQTSKSIGDPRLAELAIYIAERTA